MQSSDRFTWADAWLLISLLHSKKDDGTFELKDVIMIGDVINHAILTHSEIDEGFERLVCEGYVIQLEERLMLSAKATELLSRVSKKSRSALNQMERIEKILDATPYSKDYKINPICSGKYITAQEYEKAVKDYLLMAKKHR